MVGNLARGSSPRSIALEAEVTSKLLSLRAARVARVRPTDRPRSVQYHIRRLSECGVSGGAAWLVGGCRSDNGRAAAEGTADEPSKAASPPPPSLPPSLPLLMERNGMEGSLEGRAQLSSSQSASSSLPSLPPSLFISRELVVPTFVQRGAPSVTKW